MTLVKFSMPECNKFLYALQNNILHKFYAKVSLNELKKKPQISLSSYFHLCKNKKMKKQSITVYKNHKIQGQIHANV